ARIVRRVTGRNLASCWDPTPQSSAPDECWRVSTHQSGNTRSIALPLVAACRQSLAVLVLLVAFAAGAAAPARADAQAQPFVAAQPARALGDSVGVNLFLAWIDTAYGDFPTVESRLRELGVRYIRDGLCPTCSYNVNRLNQLAADGIRANIIVGTLAGGDAQMNATLAGIRNQVRNAVISIEAPNEPNLSGDPLWIQHAREYQQRLYAAVNGDPRLAQLPVLSPAVGYPATTNQLGNLSAWADKGNFHPYPSGFQPYADLDVQRAQAAGATGFKPLVATESGYHTDLATTGGNLPVSERAAALYSPRLVLEGFRGGVERTYFFQLADPWTDASKPAGVPLTENRFGLLRSDLSRKPSFLTVRNLLNAVDGDSAPVASPGGLRLGLEGAGPDVRQLLLRSADGSYSLVLWRGVSVWDPAKRVDLSPAPDRMDVVLGDRIALARRFDPVASEGEQQRWTDPSRIPVDVGGGPMVLKLTPPGAQAGGGGADRKASKSPRSCASRLSIRKQARCCASASRARGHKGKRRHLRARWRHGKASWVRTCVSVRRR
ncbi:MAG: hypothetical protein QOE60_2111, partial [Thermoleophilaceae bacterium]|nr:hypothetical protein [Thermoleophilaceae bacterium]